MRSAFVGLKGGLRAGKSGTFSGAVHISTLVYSTAACRRAGGRATSGPPRSGSARSLVFSMNRRELVVPT